MNEIKLSDNLQQIELEIQHHKNVAGQSIWEIGRRLSHVKEHDLTHGEFGEWLQKINIEHREANRMMKVSKEIPYSTTWSNLGNRALYLISTLPEEEREKEHMLDNGETKTVDEMTVRELEEVKRKNREQAQTIEEQQKIINEQANKKPEVVEVEVSKEVIPHDYDGLKSDNQQLEFSNRRLREQMQDIEKRNDFIEKQYNDLLEQRKEVDEKSKKYDELNEAIQEMQGRMDEGQKSIKAQKDVYDLVRKANELIVEVAPLTYLIDVESVLSNEYAQKPIKKIINNFREMADRLEKSVSQEILEGEVVNE